MKSHHEEETHLFTKGRVRTQRIGVNEKMQIVIKSIFIHTLIKYYILNIFPTTDRAITEPKRPIAIPTFLAHH